jgi:hypothetical protein
MPASAPSTRAWRICGSADEGVEQDDDAYDERPGETACQARIGSLIFRYVGSITRKTTMNMCGTLGP